jgi:hypothetical protein
MRLAKASQDSRNTLAFKGRFFYVQSESDARSKEGYGLLTFAGGT